MIVLVGLWCQQALGSQTIQRVGDTVAGCIGSIFFFFKLLIFLNVPCCSQWEDIVTFQVFEKFFLLRLYACVCFFLFKTVIGCVLCGVSLSGNIILEQRGSIKLILFKMAVFLSSGTTYNIQYIKLQILSFKCYWNNWNWNLKNWII